MGMLIEQKSRGVDLDKKSERSKKASEETPYQQAKWYADNLPYSVRPRWIIVSNFDEFRIHDLGTDNPEGDYVTVELGKLPEQRESSFQFRIQEVLTMIVDVRLCFEVDNQIVFDNPGLIADEFESLFSYRKDRAVLPFDKYRKQLLAMDFDTPSSYLVEAFADKAMFGEDRDFFYQISKLVVINENGLWFIEDSDLTIKQICNELGTKHITFGILINGNAGEHFRGKYPGYTFTIRSHEDERHIPHIHVMCHHEDQSSFSIETGKLIEGTLSRRRQHEIERIVSDNRVFLLEEWGRMHKGLVCDLDYGLGYKVVSLC